MKLLSLSCNHCGAPLEVPRKAKFVTCGFCDTRLQVHQSKSAAYTEVVEKLEANTQQLARQVEKLAAQNDLMQLDERWRRRRDSLSVRNKDGSLRVPSVGGALFAGAVAVLGGLFFFIFTAGMFPFSLFGLLFAGIGVVTAVNSYNKAQSFEVAQGHYRARRREIMRRLR